MSVGIRYENISDEDFERCWWEQEFRMAGRPDVIDVRAVESMSDEKFLQCIQTMLRLTLNDLQSRVIKKLTAHRRPMHGDRIRDELKIAISQYNAVYGECTKPPVDTELFVVMLDEHGLSDLATG